MPDQKPPLADSSSTLSADAPAKSDAAMAAFDWAIYADATAAGLATLIPIPGIDWIFEQIFRRRMPKTIAARRKVELESVVIREIIKTENGCWQSCLLMPILGILWLIKRLSKKILYFLTIKESADQVSLYWHQAFLIDQMIEQGHLTDQESARMAREAMWQVIDDTHSSPLFRLAIEVVSNTHQILGSLIKFRRGKENETLETVKTQMLENWDNFQTYFSALAGLYQQAYNAKLIEAQAQNFNDHSQQ